MKKEELENQIYASLLALFAITMGAVLWVLKSFFEVKYGIACADWFSRSGAVLVIASVLSTLYIAPHINSLVPSHLNNVLDAALYDDVELVPKHWVTRYKVLPILAWVELFLALSGTLIWAYGDIWVKGYVAVTCA